MHAVVFEDHPQQLKHTLLLARSIVIISNKILNTHIKLDLVKFLLLKYEIKCLKLAHKLLSERFLNCSVKGPLRNWTAVSGTEAGPFGTLRTRCDRPKESHFRLSLRANAHFSFCSLAFRRVDASTDDGRESRLSPTYPKF